MELKLTAAAVGMMYKMLSRPEALSPDQPYKAADSAASLEVVGLQRWFEKNKDKLADIIDGTGPSGPTKIWQFKSLNVKIKQRYVDRLKEMLEHYKNGGRLISNVEGYEDLKATLEGKEFKPEEVEEEEEAPKAAPAAAPKK